MAGAERESGKGKTMTNEQLAVLLQGYVNQLNPIIEGLTEALAGVEVERELVGEYQWKGEGPEPEPSFLSFKSITKGYELVQSFTGDPSMLFPLKEFKGQLESHISTLRGES